MNRRGFLAVLSATVAGAIATLLGCGGGGGEVADERYGESLRFVVAESESVASATASRYVCRLGDGPIFVEVGDLAGDLQYLVNGRLVLLPAKDCVLREGDEVTWRVVI